MRLKERRFGILLTFCIMAAFWILLSGIFDGFHLISGLVCCAIVSIISHDLIVKGKSEKAPEIAPASHLHPLGTLADCTSQY